MHLKILSPDGSDDMINRRKSPEDVFTNTNTMELKHVLHIVLLILNF